MIYRDPWLGAFKKLKAFRVTWELTYLFLQCFVVELPGVGCSRLWIGASFGSCSS